MASNRPLKPIPHEVAQLAYEQMRLGDAESARAHLDSVLRILRSHGNKFEE